MNVLMWTCLCEGENVAKKQRPTDRRVHLGIKVEPGLMKKIKKEAIKDGRTVSSLLRIVIEGYFIPK